MHKLTLHNDTIRQRALSIVQQAPEGYVVTVARPKRSLDQNAKLWAMLSDVSISKPEGRCATPQVWKSVFMHAYGFEVQFESGLDNRPFPVGLSTSKLTKAQMSDLIEFIYSYGSMHGVEWTEPESKATYEKEMRGLNA